MIGELLIGFVAGLLVAFLGSAVGITVLAWWAFAREEEIAAGEPRALREAEEVAARTWER